MGLESITIDVLYITLLLTLLFNQIGATINLNFYI